MKFGAYDAYFFDLDGTLVDVHDDYMQTLVVEVADELGLDVTPTDFPSLWYGSDEARNRLLRRHGVSEETFWSTFDRLDDPLSRAEKTFLYEDAAIIGAIDRPTGLVTHCPADKTEAVLDHLDIGDWFDAVVCCTDEVGWKPDPAPVERAMSRLGVDERSRGVLVGDGACDIGAAWNAGLDGIHVERYDPVDRGHCVVADVRIRNFEELSADPFD